MNLGDICVRNFINSLSRRAPEEIFLKRILETSDSKIVKQLRFAAQSDPNMLAKSSACPTVRLAPLRPIYTPIRLYRSDTAAAALDIHINRLD